MNKKGFTLIELLAVISIIGVLTTIVMTSMNGVKMKARNVIRKSDLSQIKLALESYYMENGQYIAETSCDSSLGSCPSACPCSGTDWDYANTNHIGYVLRNRGYFQNLPKDPINNSSYYYKYEPDCDTGTCTSYTLRAWMEGEGVYHLDSDNG